MATCLPSHKPSKLAEQDMRWNCWWSKDEHSAGRPGKTYIHQFCTDTGCSLEDQPIVSDDWNEWYVCVCVCLCACVCVWQRERERENQRTPSNQHDDDDISLPSCLSPLSTYVPLRLFCPIGWGCTIHRLLLCRGVRLPQRASKIWHQTVWWRGSSNAGALGNTEYLFIAIAPRSSLDRSGSPW